MYWRRLILINIIHNKKKGTKHIITILKIIIIIIILGRLWNMQQEAASSVPTLPAYVPKCPWARP